jgi:diguanylate cyclase (GGDEF)-like protein
MRGELHDLLARVESLAHASTGPRPGADRPPLSLPELPAEPAGDGLIDGRTFVQHLRRALDGPAPGPAVLLVDIDGFKSLNFGLGWETGDRVLREIGRRLVATLRHGDLVSRLAGDEFAVLLEDADLAAATDVATRLQDAVSVQLDMGGFEIFPTACIGLAMRTDAHARPEDVMKDAERALARARAFGRGRLEVFDPDLDARALTLWQLEVALRRALDNEEFRTHYEPMLSVKGGQVAGFEVLLWRKTPTGGERARRTPAVSPSRLQPRSDR